MERGKKILSLRPFSKVGWPVTHSPLRRPSPLRLPLPSEQTQFIWGEWKGPWVRSKQRMPVNMGQRSNTGRWHRRTRGRPLRKGLGSRNDEMVPRLGQSQGCLGQPWGKALGSWGFLHGCICGWVKGSEGMWASSCLSCFLIKGRRGLNDTVHVEFLIQCLTHYQYSIH